MDIAKRIKCVSCDKTCHTITIHQGERFKTEEFWIYCVGTGSQFLLREHGPGFSAQDYIVI